MKALAWIVKRSHAIFTWALLAYCFIVLTMVVIGRDRQWAAYAVSVSTLIFMVFIFVLIIVDMRFKHLKILEAEEKCQKKKSPLRKSQRNT